MKKNSTKLNSKLAIHGGNPVRTKPWSQGPFHFKEELTALRQVLSGPALAMARGPHVNTFRDLVAKTYGARHVVTTSSGTTAIHVALATAGVEPGDEVIVPPLTDHGSVIGIFQLNAVPVFCDTIENSLVMDVEKLESVITKRTKVIMPVHLAGYPVGMPALMKIARRHHLKVVEDCAQAHLTKIGNTHVGCFGDFGVFSTNESKHMKTGEGGFILCRSKTDMRYADLFADKCYPRMGRRKPSTPMFPSLNVRMSEINAAVAYEQLKRLPAWVKRRNRAGKLIDKTLSRFPLIPHWRPKNAYCSYWQSLFSIDTSQTNATARKLVKLLNAEGIPCARRPASFLPDWEIFNKLNDDPKCFATYQPGILKKGYYPVGICPIAKKAVENTMAIVVNQHTTDSQVRDLELALAKIFG